MTQQWASLAGVAALMGFLLGGAWARRSQGDNWNTALGVAFALVGVISMANLVFIGQRQTTYNSRAADKLSCIAEVVTAARATTTYNAARDVALLAWITEPGRETAAALIATLVDAPAPLPQCAIDWETQ
jgi:NADH:ubiquinone oxidoreductase subunit 2 (subunit N)